MITIFTPSYNRVTKLPALYQSLLRQSDHRFEWILVDDGSKDDTKGLVEGWKDNDYFPVRYYYQENGGKHSAINYGVKQASWDWFFIVDSDDYLTDDAVEKIHAWIETVDNDSIAAVSGVKCFPSKKIIGQCGVNIGEYIDVPNNLRKKYRLLGDKAEVYRTEILRQFTFPVFPGERFLPEGAVWDAIALAGYKVRWFSDPIMICEYLDDGLSAQNRTADIGARDFQGYTYYTQVELKVYRGLERIRIICQYINKARKKKMSMTAVSKIIDVNRYLCCILLLLVYIKELFGKLKNFGKYYSLF